MSGATECDTGGLSHAALSTPNDAPQANPILQDNREPEALA